MTGRVYSYPVTTTREFLQRVSKEFSVPMESLRLIDPEENEKKDTLMKEDTVYFLFVDDRVCGLLPWIDATKLNHFLRIDNPSYIPTETDIQSYSKYHLEYCALYSHHVTLVGEYLDHLSDRGWQRLFCNPDAGEIMTQRLDLVKHHFYEKAKWLAKNPSAVPILKIALQENWPIKNREPFLAELSGNENAFSLLLRYPDSIRYRGFFGGICSNHSPEAMTYLQEEIQKHPQLVDQLDWNHLSANPAATPILFEYPERVNRVSIYYNQNPDIVLWYTLHMDPTDDGWNKIAHYTHPTFIQYIEENMDRLPLSAWKSLSQNEAAIHLLKQDPSKIHWGLLCSNPSPEVIPMIEDRLKQDPPLSISTEEESNAGYNYSKFNVIERLRENRSIFDDLYKDTLNCGSLSLHPHALPFLENHPELIFWMSLSIHPGIYLPITSQSIL